VEEGPEEKGSGEEGFEGFGGIFLLSCMVERGSREEIKRRGRGERAYCGGCECD